VPVTGEVDERKGRESRNRGMGKNEKQVAKEREKM